MTKARKKKGVTKEGFPVLVFRRGYVPSQAYLENYFPYYNAVKQSDLGPKFPKGDPRNMDRQDRVNDILQRLKREREKAKNDALTQS